MNRKQIVRINESQLKRIVTESVKHLLKEYEIDSNLDLTTTDIPAFNYIVEMCKQYRTFRDNLGDLYDKAYEYFDTSSNFTNDSQSENEMKLKQYYWERFENVFESVTDKMERDVKELFDLEEELANSIDDWGSRYYVPDKQGNPKTNAYQDFYFDGKFKP